MPLVQLSHEDGSPISQPYRIRLRNNGEFTSPGYRRARNIHFIAREVARPSTDTLTVPSLAAVAEFRVKLLDTEHNHRSDIPYRFLSHTSCLKLDLNPFWQRIPFEQKRGGTLCPIVLALTHGSQPPIHASVLVEWTGCRRRVGRRNPKKTITKQTDLCPRLLRREALHREALRQAAVSDTPVSLPWLPALPTLLSLPGLNA